MIAPAWDFVTEITLEDDAGRADYLLPVIRELVTGPVDGVHIYRSGECQWRIELGKGAHTQVVVLGSDSHVAGTTQKGNIPTPTHNSGGRKVVKNS
jgi:hypothetical protein